jgi:hypothetical protein
MDNYQATRTFDGFSLFNTGLTETYPLVNMDYAPL